ncbi:aldehyde reductase [Trichodelitschia bisporula]|uniref:Aldehyde reductase n=1 Tax=Trichodelitschia bisporula TaxID=703511 RepID=A0A6G1HZT9_9PEZI|nr:aldehyde reductase [Trichodelitschia bisporula]
MSSGLKVVLGGAGINPDSGFPTPEALTDAFAVLDEFGVATIDTAQLYRQSETIIGQTDAAAKYTIDTKAKGGFDAGNALQPDTLRSNAYNSLKTTKAKQFDIFYIHAPDVSIPPTTWLPVLDELHRDGVFRRLGLSNFKAHQVREVYDLAVEKNLVKPTVYQGNYSPVARLQETLLFPTLRELGIAFYAYSPLAGGFLTKTREALEAGGKEAGRFATGSRISLYRELYLKPAFLDALDEWARLAEAEGATKAEVAYRWVSYHSPLSSEKGDAIIIGASSLGQLKGTLEGLKRGPLKEETVKAIDVLWEKLKDEAPLDNFNRNG